MESTPSSKATENLSNMWSTIGSVVGFLTQARINSAETSNEASSMQKEKLCKEISEIDTVNEIAVSRLRERISDKTAALDDYRKNQKENSLKYKKDIENERASNVEQIEGLNVKYSREKEETDEKFREQLSDIQAKSKIELDKVIAAHQNTLEANSKEIDNLRAAHKNETKIAEEERKKIAEEWSDQLSEQTDKISRTREEQHKRWVHEQDQLLKMRLAAAEREKNAIAQENNAKRARCNNMGHMQMLNMNNRLERELASSLDRTVRRLKECVNVTVSLKDHFESLKTDPTLSLLLISNSSQEWSEANADARNEASLLRMSINNYTTVNQQFRERVKNAMLDIETNTGTSSQSLILAINRHVSNNQIKELQFLLPQIEGKIAQMDQVAQYASQIRAPHDTSIQNRLCSQESNIMINN